MTRTPDDLVRTSPRPWRLEHDWGGLIQIFDANGDLIATLAKHASGTPGSGVPVDTHAKLQGTNAELIVRAVNASEG